MKEERNTQRKKYCRVKLRDLITRPYIEIPYVIQSRRVRTEMISSTYYGIELTIGHVTRILFEVAFQYMHDDWGDAEDFSLLCAVNYFFSIMLG